MTKTSVQIVLDGFFYVSQSFPPPILGQTSSPAVDDEAWLVARLKRVIRGGVAVMDGDPRVRGFVGAQQGDVIETILERGSAFVHAVNALNVDDGDRALVA